MPSPTRSERTQGDDDVAGRLRRAVEGDVQSLDWIVTQFTPFLLSQARYRLGKHLHGLYDPEDFVQRVWAISLPKLGNVAVGDGPCTRILMGYLSAVLLQDYRNLLQKHMGKPKQLPLDRESQSHSDDPAAALPAATSGITTKAVRSERVAELRAALDRLPDAERELMILRGIEQLPFDVIAEKLGANSSTLRGRYQDVLLKLRGLFPDQMIRELQGA